MATFDHYALVIPANFTQLSFHHTMTGVPDELIVTVGCRANAGQISQTDLDDILGAYIARLMPNASTAVTVEKVTARDAGGVVLESFFPTTGSGAGDYVPVSNCVLVEKRTGVSGRRNRGRMYMMWGAETDIDAAGNVLGASVIAYQSDMDDFQSDVEGFLGAAPGGMYILHSKGWDGGVEPADPGNAPAPTLITNFVVKNKIGTQRRRLR